MRGVQSVSISFFLLFSSVAWSQAGLTENISVLNPWSRAVPMAGMNAAGYMTLINHSDQPVTLSAVSTDIALRTSIHETINDGDMVSMKALPEGITIPAQGQVQLKPGGLHLMLMKIKRPLQEGDNVPVTLTFSSGEQMTTHLEVQPLTGSSHHHH